MQLRGSPVPLRRPLARDYLLAVQEEPGSDEKQMRLRYEGTCRVCGVALPAKAEAIYERPTKTVRCSTHDDPELSRPPATESEPVPRGSPEEPVEPGTPGASARREFERRSARREQRIRTAHPKLGGLIHALTDETPSQPGPGTSVPSARSD